MEKRAFTELGLSEGILKAVAKLGFEEASPIQSESIPALLAGRDVVGQSQTGSGKTAAFAIPAIEKLDLKLRAPQVLILCPTRELAIQVAEEVHKLSHFLPKVHAVPIYGGTGYERQFFELKKDPQIIIGTPGRIMDHMERRTLNLEALKMVILDEADRMLDMGFRDDIEKILSVTPRERQTVFFSATMPRPIKDLIERFSREPQHIQISVKEMSGPAIEQAYFEVNPRFKMDALTRVLDMENPRQGIVFCNTQRTVDEVADALVARGYSADRLHGGLSQIMRTRTMDKFKQSAFDLLVATDVAGRGIDVDQLDLVINFDLPYDPEDYVHRIGRTGRAGNKGLALSFVGGRDIYKLQGIERFIRSRIRRARIPTEQEVTHKVVSSVLDRIRERLESGDFRNNDGFIDELLEKGYPVTDVASAFLHELLIHEGIDPRRELPAAPTGRAPERPKPAPEPKVREKKPAAVVDQPATEAAPQAKAEAVPVSDESSVTEAASAEAPVAAETPAPKAPKKERAPKKAFTDDRGDFSEDRPARDERPAPRPAPTANLPAPARGFQWIRLDLGRAEEFMPRDLMTALCEDGGFDRRSVGEIKIMDHETYAQIQRDDAKDVVEAIEGAEFGDHTIKASIVRASSSATGSGFAAKRAYSGGPRSDARGPRSGPPFRSGPGGGKFGKGAPKPPFRKEKRH